MKENDNSLSKQVKNPLREMLRLSPDEGRGGSIVPSKFFKQFSEEGKKKPWKKIGQEETDRIRAIDVVQGIKRGDKEIFLPYQGQRVIIALFSQLLKERNEEEAEDIKTAIASNNPLSCPQIIRRVWPADIAEIVYKKRSYHYRELVAAELMRAAATPQLLFFNIGGEEKWMVAPIIQIIGDRDGEKININEMDIVFNPVFFGNLLKRYSYLSANFFEVWMDYGGAMYSTLLGMLLGEFGKKHRAADTARKRVKKEAKENAIIMGITITEAELLKRQDEAARKAMTKRISPKLLKRKIGNAADYSSTTEQRRRFWDDLYKAVEGLKRIGLVVEAWREGGGDIYFILNEKYTTEAEGVISLLG